VLLAEVSNFLTAARRRQTWHIAGTARVSVFPPSASNALVLLIDGQVDVSEPLGNSNSAIYSGKACADDYHLHWAEILDWRIFQLELPCCGVYAV
jgi:hypothetical protein